MSQNNTGAVTKPPVTLEPTLTGSIEVIAQGEVVGKVPADAIRDILRRIDENDI